MFLYNMFMRGTGKQEVTKYDRISFKIQLSENIPQFYESATEKPYQEEELTPSHPLYYELFPRTEKTNYVEYITKPNDTILGISLKLDISERLLRELNGLSGNIYPGMVDIQSYRQLNYPRTVTSATWRKFQS